MTQRGQVRRSRTSLKAAKGANEPWLLATNLPVETKQAKNIVDIYASRMQIEESFRDQKSERFGLGMNLHKSRVVKRMSILVMLGTIAHIGLCLIGQATQASGLHRQFQANTVSKRRVLSLCYLGLRVLRANWISFTPQQWADAMQQLRAKTRSYSDAWLN
ncbi:transposase [Ferrimonas pelagia]|uniref:Transposase IS4-like domain-containing protein n=1 Tax=Ferrimonas pelagia TaxID=1177826 RepID=A0ABP9FE36_9GAMM